MLKLFEALELRGEYDARIKTFCECLPEKRENRSRLFSRDDEVVQRPSPGFDVARTREELRKLENKRRKLNMAIQEANFHNTIHFQEAALTLVEALDLRKSLNTRIGDLHTQVVNSAYQRVIYKEGRDIVQDSNLDYAGCAEKLDKARLEFRELNRLLRAASFRIEVGFQDEKE